MHEYSYKKIHKPFDMIKCYFIIKERNINILIPAIRMLHEENGRPANEEKEIVSA